jgi:hypothetical protein
LRNGDWSGDWGRFLSETSSSSTSTSALSSLLSFSLGLELGFLLDGSIDLESSLGNLLLSESACRAGLIVIDDHVSESFLSLSLSLSGSNGGFSGLGLSGVHLFSDLGLLVLGIKKLLSDNSDEGFSFLNLFLGSDILWVQGRSFSNLNNFIFGGLKVLSDQLNISDSNSEVLLNTLISFPYLML